MPEKSFTGSNPVFSTNFGSIPRRGTIIMIEKFKHWPAVHEYLVSHPEFDYAKILNSFDNDEQRIQHGGSKWLRTECVVVCQNRFKIQYIEDDQIGDLNIWAIGYDNYFMLYREFWYDEGVRFTSKKMHWIIDNINECAELVLTLLKDVCHIDDRRLIFERFVIHGYDGNVAVD